MQLGYVSAFARAARPLLRSVTAAAVALGLGAGTLLAQGSTGKIEGRVHDQNGAPIQNAQVVIVGTAFNATTNPQGYYFINNVPAGTVDIRAVFVGYRPSRVNGVRVLAGQTITQDFTLEASTVQLSDIVVTSTQPLVPRDEVTTKQRVDGNVTKQLPVDRINSVLALQPGVVASSNGQTLSIRGGRADETATYVDGVPVNSGDRGTGFGGRVGLSGAAVTGEQAGSPVTIGTNGFEQASVTTGASSAQFGNAQAGIISIETKTGDPNRYAASVSLETDAPFGKAGTIGYNKLQAGLSGPIARNLTFSLQGTLDGQQSLQLGLDGRKYPLFVQAGIDTTVAVPSNVGSPTSDTTVVPIYNYAVYRGNCDEFANSTNPGIASNFGVSCQGSHIPSSGSSSYQAGGKLDYSFGTGSHLSLSVNQSRSQGLIFNYLALYNPTDQWGSQSFARVTTLNWTQNLAKSSERALALDAALSYQQNRFLQSPLTVGGAQSAQGKAGGMMLGGLDFLFNFDNFPIDQQLVTNFLVNQPGTRRSPFDLENRDQYNPVNQYRNNAYGMPLFEESGGPSNTFRMLEYRENRWYGRSNLDWQFDRYNRLKIGGEYEHYDVQNFSSFLTSQAFSDVYADKPARWAGYAEDRLDLGDVVLVGGLRYDWYKSNASRPYYVNPATGDSAFFPRISSAPGFDPNNPTANFVADQAHHYLSPHVQVSFPVTDKTNFRLSYAHQVEVPDFSLVLGGINTDLGITNTNHVYGSDLDFGKSITFEFGIRHAFSEDMVLDVAAYNKDNLANAAGRLVSLYDPQRNQRQDIRMITNADFGNTRGVDVRLDRRIGNFFNGTISYSYQQAKNTGTGPFTYINFGSRIVNQVSGGNQPPPQAIAPTATSRPHTIAGAFTLSIPEGWQQGNILGALFSNFGVFTVLRYASGTAYTTCNEFAGNESVVSGGVCNQGSFGGELNSARLPAFKQLDMRFTKGFTLKGVGVTAYLDARNILNLRNVLAVFVETNDVVNGTEQVKQFSSDSQGIANEAKVNSLYNGSTGAVDLSFGGAGRNGCAGFLNTNGQGAAPDCLYMLQAEQRYGNGDGVFTLAEQQRASAALYNVAAGVAGGAGRGLDNFTGPGRDMRLGLELNF